MGINTVNLDWSNSSKSIADHILINLIFLIGFFATVSVVRFAGFSLYIWLMLLVVLLLVFTGRIRFQFSLFSLLLLSASATFILTIKTLSPAYQDNSFKALFALLLTSTVGMSVFPCKPYRDALFSGLLLSVKTQVIWIFLQTICWSAFRLDLNDLVFSQMLGMVENASQYKASGLVSTGLCWNAGGIAAGFFFFMIFEEKASWKMLALIAAVMTQSSTIMIGISLVLIASFIVSFFGKNRTYRLRRSSVLVVIATMCVGCFVFILIPDIKKAIDPIVSVLIDRVTALFGSADGADSSFVAHASYYINLPELMRNMDLQTLFFGYGNDCSGLPYTALTRQYWTLDSWMLESDYVNIILSQGILGITVWTIWLCSAIVSAKKKRNGRIALFFIVMIFGGFFYNLQSVLYYWVTLLELALLFEINHTQHRSSCLS